MKTREDRRRGERRRGEEEEKGILRSAILGSLHYTVRVASVLAGSDPKTAVCDYTSSSANKALCLTSFDNDANAFHFVFASNLLSWISGLIANIFLSIHSYLGLYMREREPIVYLAHG